jgi:hypothetical protein
VPPPAAEPPAAAPAPAPAPAAEEKLPSIDVGAWLRASLTFQGANDPKKLDDQSMGAYGELHASGKVHKNVSYTLNLNANGLAGTAGIMDAIIGLDFVDEFHIWSGQLLVPVDRSNFSGPFFMTPWSYPGFFTVGANTVVAAPAEGPSGRNIGSSIWGDINKGMFKYYAGMFNLGNKANRPLFSGRLGYAAIGAEPGYYNSSTYYGDQDILAFGVGAQYQKDGTTATDPTTGAVIDADDYSDINVDALAEFKLGESGVISAEAAYYHYSGDYTSVDDHFFGLVSFLSPEVGVGKLQPMVRYQWAKKDDLKVSMIDAQVAYVVKGPTMRATLGFQHTDLGDDAAGESQIGNAIMIGLQTIQF